MQLKPRRNIREKLARVSAGLLAATVPIAAGRAAAQPYYGYDDNAYGENDSFGPGISYSQIDAALLVYQESGGRVSATEPTLDLSMHGADGRQLNVGLVADAVSGATPNGAVPSDRAQNFVTPVKVTGTTTTVTSASGGSTIIHLAPTPGQIAAASLGRQYTVPANTLPMDKGFRDHRGALSLGWSQPLGAITEVGVGGSFSLERDYQALGLNTHAAQTFNGNNTTVSLALNAEFDTSTPFGGIPTPLAVMSADFKTPASRDKSQLGFVVGITQMVTRRWLMQLNYSFDRQSGYQNDPYRIISQIDPVSGEPLQNLYENRPEKRQSQSVFWENKLSLGPAITDLSARYYKDSWGITSKTVELSERLNFGSVFYLEPDVRWYSQTAANFFQYFLVGGQALPTYATSDLRLGKFDALTYGAKIGFTISKRSEIYIKAAYYDQTGNGHPSDAIGQLRAQNLFSGTKASTIFLGYIWDFH